MTTTKTLSSAAAFLALTLGGASAGGPFDDLPGYMKQINPVPFNMIVEHVVGVVDNVASYEVEPTAAAMIATGIFTYDKSQCMPLDERIASLGHPLVGFAGEIVYDDGNFAAFFLDGWTYGYGRWVILTTHNTGDMSCTTNITLVETAEQD